MLELEWQSMVMGEPTLTNVGSLGSPREHTGDVQIHHCRH
jgi:hypothetical protein